MKTFALSASALFIVLCFECVAGTDISPDKRETNTTSTDFLVPKKKKSRGGDISFGTEGHLGFIKLGDYKSFGLGANFIWNANEKMSLFAGLEYFLPTAFGEGSNDLTPINSLITPPATVSVSYKVSVLRINFNGQYYFVKTNDDDFNVFAVVGGSYALASVSESVSGFDASKYTYTSGSSSSVGQLYINLGIGTEIKVGPGYVVVNGQLNLPANQANGQAIDVNLPGSLLAVAGYKIPF